MTIEKKWALIKLKKEIKVFRWIIIIIIIIVVVVVVIIIIIIIITWH